jgi:integrase
MKPRFVLAVFRVADDQQRRVEERLLRFGLTHAVLIGALPGVARVPVEADHPIPVDHTSYIFDIDSDKSAAIRCAQQTLGWRIENPVAGCRLSEPEGRVRYLDADEWERLMDAARESPKAPSLMDFIVLAVNTGMPARRAAAGHVVPGSIEGRRLLLEAEHTKGGRDRGLSHPS